MADHVTQMAKIAYDLEMIRIRLEVTMAAYYKHYRTDKISNKIYNNLNNINNKVISATDGLDHIVHWLS